jgi:hypothetical protein
MFLSTEDLRPFRRHRCAVISERAATRGRNAMAGGEERAGVKTGHAFDHQLTNARGERRDQGRARSSMTYQPTGMASLPRGRSRPHSPSVAGNDAQGDVGVSDRIEASFSLHPNVDLRDVRHQRPHNAAKRRFRKPRFLQLWFESDFFVRNDAPRIGELAATRGRASEAALMRVRARRILPRWRRGASYRATAGAQTQLYGRAKVSSYRRNGAARSPTLTACRGFGGRKHEA